MNNLAILAQEDPMSPAAEAFRMLRTNLRFSSIDKPSKTILVTSVGPGEGKSEIIANLGAVIAQAGAQVIIADFDLRFPEQHKLFGLANEAGVTNVLAIGAEVGRVVRMTSIPNLLLVTAGISAPNPSELVQTQRARELLDQLADMCDFLLLDVPPLLTRADAAVLSSMADGVIMVVRTGRTKIEAALEAKNRLGQAGARILGTVLND